MPDLLNGIARGTGTVTSTLLTMQGGRFQKTLATNVPGNEILPAGANDGVQHNCALFADGLYHSVSTDVYATAPPNGTLTPTWTTRDTTRQGTGAAAAVHSGLHACLTSAGPGVVHALRNVADGTTRVVRFDSDGASVTVFDQTAGTEFTALHPIYSSAVVGGNQLFLFGNNSLCQVWNLETGALTIITGVFGNHTKLVMEAGGTTYLWNRTGSNIAAFFAFLGGTWVKVIEDPTALAMGVINNGAGAPGWARKGKLYGCMKYNTDDGWSMFEFDPSTLIWTDVTLTLLHPLLRPNGGFSDSAAAQLWTAGFYVDVDSIGNPKYMLQVFPGLSDTSPGCALFEHTDAGLILVGDTDLNGGSNSMQIAHSNAAALSYNEVTGKLWARQWDEPVSDALGMLLTFRFGGDPGSADKVIRISHAAPNGAPETRSNTLVAPGGGLGQGGASLVDEGGGVYHVAGWDADGATNLTVIHRTLLDGISNGVPTEWTAKISET